MFFNNIPVWKEAPFIRLVIPLSIGIIIEWYHGFSAWIYLAGISICFAAIILFSYLKSFDRFNYYWISGILISFLFVNTGCLLAYNKNENRHNKGVTGAGKTNNYIVASLTEPLSEKDNSFKTIAAINSVFYNDSIREIKGNVLIYFQKDSAVKNLTYGSHISFRKNLQAIKNPGNPGAFDYRQYCAFQQIYFQVYLKTGDYILLPENQGNYFNKFLFLARDKIVDVLRTYISAEKEAGLAEALLIGFKDDLDKQLVQAYSNTGVVHIIAISGLHLALIYWLLTLLLKPLPRTGGLRWVRAGLIITALWLLSLLTGGSPSVCRSAVMFSFIVIGENSGKRTNIYNSLAASAFLLLCYNPYWLWDAGFQLSYIAVLSIVIFMKPVYNWFYIKNKLLDQLWKMAAISIAAQVLTTPVSMYHFHQFPNYFLITNIVAVPLSSLVVLAELALYIIATLPILATPLGTFTSWLIKLMDSFIEYVSRMPFSTANQLPLSFCELIISYLFIFSASTWMFQKSKKSLVFGCGFLLCFVISRGYDLFCTSSQNKMIVYNIVRHPAIDFITGDHCIFLSDSLLFNDASVQNYILKPSRLENRANIITESVYPNNTTVELESGIKNILIIDGHMTYQMDSLKKSFDVVIISENPDINISELSKTVNCKKIVFDNSNSTWKINKWKTDCDKLAIPYYSVAEKGAFILNLN